MGWSIRHLDDDRNRNEVVLLLDLRDFALVVDEQDRVLRAGRRRRWQRQRDRAERLRSAGSQRLRAGRHETHRRVQIRLECIVARQKHAMREGTVFGESRLVADILQRPAAELERAAWRRRYGRHARRNRRDEVGPAVRDRTETDAGAAGVTRRRRHGDRRLVNLRLELRSGETGAIWSAISAT